MALHRELVEAEKAGGAAAPSKSASYRAVQADLSDGDRAGLRQGERARRSFDVFLRRPASFRNTVWEADHVEAPVQVEVDGRLVKPWVTWFVDAAHDVILGVAVTPRTPNRESVLAALRAAVMRRDPYGPAGGLPAVVRVDRGKDFLSRTVAEAMGALAVRVDDLPAYSAHLKGMVGMVGTDVRIWYMPHHLDEIEVFAADTGAHLGTAVLSDAASPDTRARVQAARSRKAARVRSDLEAAERARRADTPRPQFPNRRNASMR